MATIYGTNGADTLVGTEGDDTIFGNGPGAAPDWEHRDVGDLIHGGDGNDSINGWFGRDTVYGGEGNDTIQQIAGGSFIDGGPGNDYIYAPGYQTAVTPDWSGDNTVYGGDGNDTIAGYSLVDGGAGDDVLRGDLRGGTVIGGAGNDTLGSASDYNSYYPSATFDYSGASTDYAYTAGHWGATSFNWIDSVTDTRPGSPDGHDTILQPAGFHFSDGSFSSEALLALPCYLRGTRILTSSGEVPVEALRAGDLVVTCLGRGARLKPVLWLGHRHLDLRRHPQPRLCHPIRIRAGALADGVPGRDLLVSPSHALCLEGHLVRAEDLVNGATITQERREEVAYFHIELAAHDILLAEGTPAESWLDQGNRAHFSNAPVAALRPDLAAGGADGFCLPFLDAAACAALAQRLAARAEALGWRRALPDIHLLADGRRLAPEHTAPGHRRFRLPPAVRALHLRCPVEASRGRDPGCADGRLLGLALSRIELSGPEGACSIAADDVRLARGFHAAERRGQRCWRWTDGCGELSAIVPAGGGLLDLHFFGICDGWLPPAEATAGARAVA
ncbi:hemolysin type calcium-binding protein [Humitalea rosea]|uniref:Hemolysin type calcium-binding protein n=1 Tax=Humitalea rosea TaxID=990373 RepID=A0A2W7HZC4_9PROT|nr:Hint domain-containing protein [Humitalea rosea]PZW39844.1 hemolysin type calcium-binding protein [Humitalea rosea]